MFVASRYATKKRSSAYVKALSSVDGALFLEKSMEKGRFYFIDNSYFAEFTGTGLLHNKETTDRPCFLSIQIADTGIHWMVPISSKIDKYKKIHHQKVAKYGRCDTILFGEVLGYEKAFLIQNMFPVTDRYITTVYTDHANIQVRVNQKLERELFQAVSKVLRLLRNGSPLVFADVLAIEERLLDTRTACMF